MDLVPALARWMHFMAGIMWIGLLYYFNFVQVAALKAAAADSTAAGITKHVAPRALLFFRWAAVVTWLAGAALLGGQFVAAFTLRKGMAGIGVGAWLGTIMLFNVWALIWPNQQKILGHEARDRRGEEQGAPGRVPRVAGQHDAVDPDAVLHGRRLVAPGDLRAVANRATRKRPGEPAPRVTRAALSRPLSCRRSARQSPLSLTQSPYSFCTRSRRSCASSDSVAVGRASSRGMPIGSPVSSQ